MTTIVVSFLDWGVGHKNTPPCGLVETNGLVSSTRPKYVMCPSWFSKTFTTMFSMCHACTIPVFRREQGNMAAKPLPKGLTWSL